MKKYASCEVLNKIYWNASNLKLNEAKEKNKSKQNAGNIFSGERQTGEQQLLKTIC